MAVTPISASEPDDQTAAELDQEQSFSVSMQVEIEMVDELTAEQMAREPGPQSHVMEVLKQLVTSQLEAESGSGAIYLSLAAADVAVKRTSP